MGLESGNFRGGAPSHAACTAVCVSAVSSSALSVPLSLPLSVSYATACISLQTGRPPVVCRCREAEIFAPQRYFDTFRNGPKHMFKRQFGVQKIRTLSPRSQE